MSIQKWKRFTVDIQHDLFLGNVYFAKGLARVRPRVCKEIVFQLESFHLLGNFP